MKPKRKPIDAELAKKFHTRALRQARMYGYKKEDCEDCAQSVIARFLANPDTGQTVEEAVIDITRQLKYPKGFPRGKMTVMRPHHSRVAGEHTADKPFGLDLETMSDLDALGLKIPQRVAVLLSFGVGMTPTEAGYFMGVSAGRVCQLITEACVLASS